MEPREFRMTLGGRELVLETGRLAKQAGGSVLVRYGDTVVLVTATASAQPREGVDFFPLTVDYEERLYAVGKIPGNWFRREGKPTTKAILNARLTDRPIRPLFPDGFRNDVQVICTVLSVDPDCAPEFCAMVGASAALHISDIPWEGPIGACIVGRVDGEFVVNPTAEQAERSEMHLVVAATDKAVLMVEAGAREVPEEIMLEGILFGHEVSRQVIRLIEEMRQAVGKPKRDVPLYRPPAELEQAVRELATEPLRRALVENPGKQAREEAIAQVGADVHAALAERFPDQEKDISALLKTILKEEVRRAILRHGIRPDGRRLDEIRPLHIEVGVLPRTHGSGLFQRGQTQVLSVCTLGTVSDVQRLDDLTLEEFKRYMHHYNFPPFSVGETRPMRGPGRREIGHGALAERALEPVLPSEDEFPYTIRVVSEVLESNGSTSMASTCGSTLALMDAGVPIKAPVAGIAMGLVEGEPGEFAVLTDIQGIEDALGDMDFKVAGTRKGVTALQMDMKISGTTREVFEKALTQARQARLFILDEMLKVLPAPRPELSPWAPRIITMKVHPDKIREVIGPGGKMINKIIAECAVNGRKPEIDIEDDGTVHIAAVNVEAGEKARRMIEALVKDPEPGSIYTGKVVRLMNFGAFVEILPGKEGLVHISELAEGRVERVEDVVNIGDELTVMVTEIDKLGRINLSRKAVLRAEREKRGEPLPAGAVRRDRDGRPGRPAAPPPPARGDRPPGRHGDRRPDRGRR
ncbi:polyribonucleotide nucleotidyltransferase [Caldinitratiruptor microaerophilus]|uniref:Polyribonucleotide nucleotidyltransferase n=2 Tax=Caldinitratiruptor microaerophilus TaxID=671077 RepID=A0AA35CLC0_9FIRM|nr:polyribonucleotide nucleotidyltransferase [Caldinitratiruptor microaerophilus]